MTPGKTSGRAGNQSRPVDYAGSTVLVTGASSGLGTEFARRFAERGADLVLVARREDRLNELADELRSAHGISAQVIAADLSEPGAADRLVETLDGRGIRVDSLINNAGFGLADPLVDTEPDTLIDMVMINVVALTGLTRLLLPRLIAGGRGVLINIASTAAYQPTPGAAGYGATKAYVLSFTEAVAQETRGSGLRVLALSPGPTRTEFFEKFGEDSAVGRFQTPEQVIGAALAELDRANPRPSLVSGRLNQLTATVVRLLPRRVALAASARAMK